MLPLETKQSGGKLLPHSDLRGGSVSRGSTTQQETEKGHQSVYHQITIYIHYMFSCTICLHYGLNET